MAHYYNNGFEITASFRYKGPSRKLAMNEGGSRGNTGS